MWHTRLYFVAEIEIFDGRILRSFRLVCHAGMTVVDAPIASTVTLFLTSGPRSVVSISLLHVLLLLSSLTIWVLISHIHFFPNFCTTCRKSTVHSQIEPHARAIFNRCLVPPLYKPKAVYICRCCTVISVAIFARNFISLLC